MARESEQFLSMLARAGIPFISGESLKDPYLQIISVENIEVDDEGVRIDVNFIFNRREGQLLSVDARKG